MFSTGEFAMLAHVSHRTLRYYDDIGLFRPHYIDPQTGYRYYTASQLPDLNKILALKQLGLTLEEIKVAKEEEINADVIRGMLLMKKAQIKQNLDEEMRRLRNVELHLQQIESDADQYDVVLKQVPTQPFLSSRFVFDSHEKMGTCFMDILYHMLQLDINIGPYVAVIYEDGFGSDAIDIAFGFLVGDDFKDSALVLSEEYRLRAAQLPAIPQTVTITCPVHLGRGAYAFAANWMELNQYQLAGPGREVYIEPTIENFADNLLEMQLPVQSSQDMSLSPK